MSSPTELKELLTERAQLVRAYEAACHLPFPTDQDTAFRLAISKKLALSFNMRELKPLSFTGAPTAPAPYSPAPDVRKR